MGKKIFAIILSLAFFSTIFVACKKDDNTDEEDKTPVTLTVAGAWADSIAIDAVAREFKTEYSNVTIVYENIQDYYNNVVKRMEGDNRIDLFFTTNIQSTSPLLQYALDLKSREDFDLSNTFDGLIDNFTLRETETDTERLYAIPLGAEMRGLYVNKTLLNSMDLEVPTTKTELLAACQKIASTNNPLTDDTNPAVDDNYIPFHGNPGSFGQKLMYPWICNQIANASNYSQAYESVNTRQAGSVEYFREPMNFLYDLMSNGYYEYKLAEGQGLFKSEDDINVARDFLNIKKDGDNYVKVDDLGQVAFMPGAMSLKGTIDKAKEDYHSDIEYVFIPAPLDDNGGFVYLSPAHGIAANKYSRNLDWTVKFLDFLFTPKNNEIFAEKFNVIPNTEEAFSYIYSLYNVPNRNISHLGQVSFDFNFYQTITTSLVEVSKGNNPKYMQGEENNKTFYAFNYYLDKLKTSLVGTVE